MPFILALLISLNVSVFPSAGTQRITRDTMEEGKAVRLIEEKLAFLRLTYEQFRHPTFKYLKFPESCIVAVKINGAVETKSGLLSKSTVFYGEDFRAGFCPHQSGAQKGSFVLLYCRKSSTLIQVRCLDADCGNTDWNEQC